MPDSTSRFDGENCYIIVNPSLGKFHLYGDDQSELNITDIAQALSNQCRFTGHMSGDNWYSVAQHSVDVSEIIALLGGSKFEQYCGLMHDTPEAFLTDIAAPFKRELGNYYDKEALIWARIAAKFELPEKLPTIVKQADWIALFLEARAFVVDRADDPLAILKTWVGYDPYGKQAETLNYGLIQRDRRKVREDFLSRFQKLSTYATA